MKIFGWNVIFCEMIIDSIAFCLRCTQHSAVTWYLGGGGRLQTYTDLQWNKIVFILCKPVILKRDISGVFMTQSKCWSPGLLIVSTESLMLPDYKSRGILSFAWAAKVFCTFLCLQFLALWFTLKNFTASFNLNFQLNNAINRKIEESRPPPKFHST